MATPIRQTAIAVLNSRLTSTLQRLYNTEVAVGLDLSGNYVKDQAAHYISNVSSVAEALTTIDKQLYSVATTFAPTSYVDTQIANLVDSAPATLSTLFLIDQAINNDSTIAITLGNQLSAEATRARAAELVLRTDLSGEIVRALQAESTLRADLSAETVRAIAAEAQLTTDLASEVTRATTNDQLLSTLIATEVTNRTDALSTLTATTSSKLSDLSGNLNQSLASEVTRATAAETFLTNALTTELNRALAAELVLRTDLSGEIVRASQAESTLRADLSAEITRATDAESTLSARTSIIEDTYINKNGSVAFTGNLDMSNYSIKNLSYPSASTDAANKKYVDDSISSLGRVLNYAGTFDPTTQSLVGLPSVGSGGGDYFLVTAPGTISVNGSGITLNTGDAIIRNASGWDKLDNTDPDVYGTAGYIDVSGNGDAGYTVTISPSYVGQTSITTLGTVTQGTWNADVIGTAYGGSGFSNYTTGDLLVGNGSGSLDKLPIGSTGTVLRSDGTTPSWVVADTEHVAVSDVTNFGGNNTNVQQALDYLFNYTQIRKVAQHVIQSSTDYADSNAANTNLLAGKVNFINFDPANSTIYMPPSDAGILNGTVIRLVHNGDFTDNNLTVQYQDKVAGSNVNVLELAPKDSIALVWNEAQTSYLFAVGI